MRHGHPFARHHGHHSAHPFARHHAHRDPDPAALRLTRRDVDEIYGTMRDAHHVLARDDGHSSGAKTSVGERALEAGEVLGGAILVGTLAARLGTANIPGSSIPLGPTLGILGHVAAVFNREIGIPDKFTEHMHNVSNGLIAGWGALYGMGIGQGLREKAGLPPQDVRVGALGAGSARSLQSASIGACGAGCLPMPNVRARPMTEAEQAALYRRAA